MVLSKRLRPDLRLIEARGVVCVGELGRAPGQDLVDGQAADVVLTQEPVQHVIIHGGAGPAPGLGPQQGYLERISKLFLANN